MFFTLMSESNEQVCLLAFNIFGLICVVYSSIGIYDLGVTYSELAPSQKEECHPYVVWKVAFLLHIAFFFICLSFSVGAAQNYLNDDENENERRNRNPSDANGSIYRLRFDKMVENALDVVRVFCILFCGPLILLECFLSVLSFSSITSGCPYIEDALSSILVYVLIVLGCVSIAVTGFCCYATFLFFKTVNEVWPQLRNPNA